MSELQQKCLMCFNQTPDPVKMFSQKGRSLKIAEIISKHFWFEVNYKRNHFKTNLKSNVKKNKNNYSFISVFFFFI